MKKIACYVILLISLFFLCSCGNGQKTMTYDELYDAYVALEENCESLRSQIDDMTSAKIYCEDPMAIIYCYIEGEDDISQEEAQEAYQELREHFEN